MPAKVKAKVDQSAEEGAVYIAASGAYYSKPQIDAKKIYDSIQNNYLADQVGKLRSQIFTERFDIEVRDPDGGIDEELQARLRAMCDAKDVKLWSCMQQAWEDVWYWGCAPFNPVWEAQGAEKVLVKLRRLPPYSFAYSPMDMRPVYSEILQGISLNAGEVEFYQTPSELNFVQVQLRNVLLMKDPTSTELAGTSKILPIVPLISMLDFCWQAQMQKVNRVGAPTLFVKVTNPVKNANRDDIAYANTILKNWGKGTAYQLRENMEIVELNITDNEAALATIDALKVRIKEFFSPSELFKKEGSTLGGNAAAEKELFDSWVEGQHQWIEDQFEQLLQQYLDVNAFEGYTAHIIIGSQNVGVGDLEVKQAQVGYLTRSLTKNEIREKLGAPNLSDEELATLMDEYAKAAPPAQPPGQGTQLPFGFKEHRPGRDELDLEAELQKAYDEAAQKVTEALRNEEGTG